MSGTQPEEFPPAPVTGASYKLNEVSMNMTVKATLRRMIDSPTARSIAKCVVVCALGGAPRGHAAKGRTRQTRCCG